MENVLGSFSLLYFLWRLNSQFLYVQVKNAEIQLNEHIPEENASVDLNLRPFSIQSAKNALIREHS